MENLDSENPQNLPINKETYRKKSYNPLKKSFQEQLFQLKSEFKSYNLLLFTVLCVSIKYKGMVQKTSNSEHLILK